MERRSVGTRRWLLVSLALLSVPVVSIAAAPGFRTAETRSSKRGKPSPCPDQRYLVQGAPVLPGDSSPEAIAINGRQISLGGNCGLTAAKVAGRPRGTRARAKWPSCTGIRGKVKLVATIDPACELMTGIVRARGLKLRKRFTARLSTCGDGVLDLQAGERCAATVIAVDTTTDVLGDGLCSFQEAVQAANTATAVDACAAGGEGATNTIAFNIPGSGVHTITVTTVTQVTSALAIDGSTQPGYAGVPLIHITGVVEDLLRFDVNATGSSLRYLMLTNTNGGGLTDGATALFYGDGNHIVGNYFNTDGVTVVGAYGAGLLFESEHNVIGGPTAAERNIFGGQTGIYLQDSSRNLVEGNYFGLQADGITAITGLPQNGNAIQIFNVLAEASANTIRGNVITGFLVGVQLYQGAHANTLLGNYVGVAADGVTVRSNGIGVLVYGAPDNAIGGAAVADRNVISGNTATNITLQTVPGYGADDNAIAGNYIGPDATGSSVSPNALFGIYVVGGASGNVVSENVIAGSEQGVYIDETSTVASGSSQNCISGNSTYGVNNANSVSAPLENNWWGDASGPRFVGHGVGGGDWVSSNVTVAPFLTSEPAACAGMAVTGQPLTTRLSRSGRPARSTPGSCPDRSPAAAARGPASGCR